MDTLEALGIAALAFLAGVWVGRRAPGREPTPIPPPAEPPPAEILEEVRQVLGRGEKIQAIKLYREHTGAGLKEAKEAVEALDEGPPAVG